MGCCAGGASCGWGVVRVGCCAGRASRDAQACRAGTHSGVREGRGRVVGAFRNAQACRAGTPSEVREGRGDARDAAQVGQPSHRSLLFPPPLSTFSGPVFALTVPVHRTRRTRRQPPPNQRNGTVFGKYQTTNRHALPDSFDACKSVPHGVLIEWRPALSGGRVRPEAQSLFLLRRPRARVGKVDIATSP